MLRINRLPYTHTAGWLAVLAMLTSLMFSGCTSAPLSPYSEYTPPLALVPASQAGVVDKRGRFREIFCGVLEARGTTLPDYRACDDALVEVGNEPDGTGQQIELGQSKRRLVAVFVPGVGWDCFSSWLQLRDSSGKHVRQFSYDLILLKVDALSSSAHNARLIRDGLRKITSERKDAELVLIGYSKGATDILEAVVAYPEIRKQIGAVISIAGSIGGSPLANDASQSDLDMLRHWPGANCTIGDDGAVESLRPDKRKAWLAKHPLPDDFPYYSLVTYPKPERISSILQSTYKKLSQIDARNDSQLLFYDQIIPGSRLLGYANADHWALAVPIERSHSTLGATLVDQNDYPREAMLEALLRFVEEDFAALKSEPNQR